MTSTWGRGLTLKEKEDWVATKRLKKSHMGVQSREGGKTVLEKKSTDSKPSNNRKLIRGGKNVCKAQEEQLYGVKKLHLKDLKKIWLKSRRHKKSIKKRESVALGQLEGRSGKVALTLAKTIRPYGGKDGRKEKILDQGPRGRVLEKTQKG